MQGWNPCLVGGIDPTDPNALDEWLNCTVADCQYKVCTWSGTALCFQHADDLLGCDELVRRYDATHERTWTDMEAEG